MAAAVAKSIPSKSESSLEFVSGKPCKYSKSLQEPYHKLP
jgi:hypothetical protein